MTRALAGRLAIRLLLALLLLLPAARPVSSQEPTDSAMYHDVRVPITGDAGLLRPTRLVYAVSRATDTATVLLGERIVELREATYGEVPAWSLVEWMRGPHLAAGEDSLLLRRADLRPLRWQSLLGSARLAAEFSRDTLYAALQAPAIRRSVSAAVPPDVIPSAGAIERWLEVAGLHDEWLADVSLLLVDLDGARVVDARLEVEGSATVQVPAGEWDAWRVLLRTSDGEKRFWVRKEQPVVLRTHQFLPGAGWHSLETALVSEAALVEPVGVPADSLLPPSPAAQPHQPFTNHRYPLTG